MSEIVRVLRLVEYVGPRKWVEASVKRAIHGTRTLLNGARITAVTLTKYPEVLTTDQALKEDTRIISGLVSQKLVDPPNDCSLVGSKRQEVKND